MNIPLVVVGTFSSGNSSNFSGCLQKGHPIGVCTASSKHGIPFMFSGIIVSFALWLIVFGDLNHTTGEGCFEPIGVTR